MPTSATTSPSEPARESRRGRPRAGEREAREQQVVEAALQELLEHGYDGVTMLRVAKRAGASKETLYKWFGNKEGLFAALIRANADGSAERIKAALSGDTKPQATLEGYATGLLMLLTSPGSVALNRAAMSSPALATELLAHGRHRVGPLVEAYLDELNSQGYLEISNSAEAFQLLYGLVIQDTQIRVLLGEDPPSAKAVQAHAKAAVSQFLELTRA